jgi:putative oxidoreductase
MQAPSQLLSGAVPLVGRILLGAIFLISGFGKIAAPAGAVGYIASAGLPLPQVGLAVGIAIEVIGGILLIAGYQTRIVAGVFAAYCLATAALFHNNLADQNQFVHFFKNVAMAGGMLQVLAFGAGRLSLDAWRTR